MTEPWWLWQCHTVTICLFRNFWNIQIYVALTNELLHVPAIKNWKEKRMMRDCDWTCCSCVWCVCMILVVVHQPNNIYWTACGQSFNCIVERHIYHISVPNALQKYKNRKQNAFSREECNCTQTKLGAADAVAQLSSWAAWFRTQGYAMQHKSNQCRSSS